MKLIKREVIRAAAWGTALTLLTAIAIIVGSRNLSHFDAALVAYTFAVLFSVFGVAYRYTMWLQRPPTKMYWKRGWQVFFYRTLLPGNIVRWAKRLITDFAFNRFIFKRGPMRWVAHFCIMWGCLLAFAITYPLVFGWMNFFTVPGKIDWYRAYVFGFAVMDFPAHSFFAFVIFHGLVWSAFLVIAGVMIAMYRRMRDHGAAAIQQFTEDILPLILLFAISVTGLMLVASYTWMRGYGYEFIAILHAITVIFTLLYLPFGKFFHIFQRPAQLGASFYKDAGKYGEKAYCRRCQEPFSSVLHVQDLITVEKQLGYNYEMDNEAEHYQWICPPCRRSMLALAQGLLWAPEHGDEPMVTSLPHPAHPALGINVIGENPQGIEDKKNLHF
ncbi:MAG: MFS transporter [Abditibacteriaceae bacterium]